jgi:hypothetical protein
MALKLVVHWYILGVDRGNRWLFLEDVPKMLYLYRRMEVTESCAPAAVNAELNRRT